MKQISRVSFLIVIFLCIYIFNMLSCANGGGRTGDYPGSLEDTTSTFIKPSLDVYLENSASIDGFFSSTKGFQLKEAIHGLLTKFNRANVFERAKLFYVNNKIIPHVGKLKNYIQTLNVASFRKRGGDRSSSYFSEIFNMILDNYDSNRVSLLITDAIISTTEGITPALEKNNIIESLGTVIDKHSNLAVLIVKSKASFNGTYYCQDKSRISISNKNRPYYLIFIGDNTHLTNVLLSDILTGVENLVDYYYLPPKGKQPPFNLLVNHPDARGRYVKRGANTLKKARVERGGLYQGKFSFCIETNLSNFPANVSYGENDENYQVSSNYFISAIREKERSTIVQEEKYNHLLFFETDDLKNEKIHIQLKFGQPSWVNATYSENDLAMTTAELDKTYAFKYLIEGIEEAFDYRGGAIFFDMNFTIEQ